jgi:hypothetical protein
VKRLFIGILIIMIIPSIIFAIDVSTVGRGTPGIALPDENTSFKYNPAGFTYNKNFKLGFSGGAYGSQEMYEFIRNSESNITNIVNFFSDSTVQSNIESWASGFTVSEFEDIISESGYTETDISNAGGISPFLASLSSEEQIKMFQYFVNESSFPYTYSDAGLPEGEMETVASFQLSWISKSGFALGLFVGGSGTISSDNLVYNGIPMFGNINMNIGYGTYIIHKPTFDLSFGLQFKPYYNMVASMTSIASTSTNILYGYEDGGITLDTGITMRWGWFNIGASVLNLIRLNLYHNTFTESTIFSFNNSGVQQTWIFEPTYMFGIAINPRFKTINPILYADFTDINSIYIDISNSDYDNLLDLISFGAEIQILEEKIVLMGGYNKGIYSFGAGVHLFGIEINAALYSDNFTFSPDSDNFGMAIETAISF